MRGNAPAGQCQHLGAGEAAGSENPRLPLRCQMPSWLIPGGPTTYAAIFTQSLYNRSLLPSLPPSFLVTTTTPTIVKHEKLVAIKTVIIIFIKTQS